MSTEIVRGLVYTILRRLPQKRHFLNKINIFFVQTFDHRVRNKISFDNQVRNHQNPTTHIEEMVELQKKQVFLQTKIFRDNHMYFHVQEGHRDSFRLEFFIN